MARTTTRQWRRARSSVLALLALFLWASAACAAVPSLDAVAAGPRPAARLAGATSPPWAWPLVPVPRVVRPFDKPPTPYAAGHRGVDLAGSPGQEVLAVDDGVVTHVGMLAGRGTLTLEHAGDVRSTYEPITSSLARGARVNTGQVLGTLDTAQSHCPPASCLHLGALRRGSDGVWDYVQPLFLLQAVEVILLPTGR